MSALKIGLLGGSFNPAHEGHLYISRQALDLLGLDELWWLVSPQNPLKNTSGMAPLAERMAKATIIASECPKITVSDFEHHAKTRYTYDTIMALKAKYPDYNFVWLMGADNLLQFSNWYKWLAITKTVPIAVFNRDNLKPAALAGEVAVELATHRVSDLRRLAASVPPAWAYLDIKTHPLSSTALRQH